MSAEHRRLLDARPLTAGLAQRLDEAFDAGAYNTLEVSFRVLKPGTSDGTPSGRLELWHAAVNESEAYELLASADASLDSDAQSHQYVHVPYFLRYIIWKTNADVAGNPVALIDIIAKQ